MGPYDGRRGAQRVGLGLRLLMIVSLSFFAFLALFTVVGMYASKHQQGTTEDYLVASRSVSPWLTALSAVSSNNSGFMFIGLVGAVYTTGVSGSWIMVGWVMGDWLTWFFVHRRLREGSERVGANTIPTFLAHGLDGARLVSALAGLLVLVFLSIYASAQLTAGGKALEAFGIDSSLGIVLGAGIVLVYCVSGGIRASIWTDAVQSIVMFVAIALLLVMVVIELGGVSAMVSTLRTIDPTLVEWVPETDYGFPLFLTGWMFAGMGVIGQPHIMIRAMAIDDADNIARARRLYMVWNALFAVMCIAVGLAARAYFSVPLQDAEMAFPLLSKSLLPAVLVGMMLAGLFAAIISTADSQVLSSAAALTQDVTPMLELFGRGGRYQARLRAHPYLVAKLGTLVVTLFVLFAALFAQSVFARVLFAWSALASAFGPLMIVRVMGWRINAAAAMAMMLSGVGAVLLWIFVLPWSGVVYEAMPGMLSSALSYGLYRLLSMRARA